MTCKVVHKISIVIVSRYVTLNTEDTFEIPVRSTEVDCAKIEDVLTSIARQIRSGGFDASILITYKNSFRIDVKLLTATKLLTGTKTEADLFIRHELEVIE